MASNVTLEDLRDRARERANLEGPSAFAFATDGEVTRMVNSAIRRLYNMLVEARGHYYASLSDVSTVVGTDTYALPTDFFQLLSVQAERQSDRWLPVDTFELREEYRYRYSGALGSPETIHYTLFGGSMLVLPVPTEVFTLRRRYIPVFTDLVEADDTFDSINGFEDYVVLSVAKRLLDKEESDSAPLAAEMQEIIREIKTLAPSRDAGAASQVVDTRRDEIYYGSYYDVYYGDRHY